MTRRVKKSSLILEKGYLYCTRYHKNRNKSTLYGVRKE